MKSLLLLPAAAALALTALLLLYPSADPEARPAPRVPWQRAAPPSSAGTCRDGCHPGDRGEARDRLFDERSHDGPVHAPRDEPGDRMRAELEGFRALRGAFAARREADTPLAEAGTDGGAGAVADTEPAPLDGYGAYVSGTVLREGTGEPVPGCSVAAYPGGVHTETAADGTFRVGPLPPGEFHLLAVSDDRGVRRVGPVTLREADSVTVPPIELPAR